MRHQQPPSGPLQLRIGEALARCPRCDHVDFIAASGEPTSSVALMRCLACGHEMRRGTLLVRMADEALHLARAAAARYRRWWESQPARRRRVR